MRTNDGQVRTLKVAIAGRVPGCKGIMDIIFAEKLGQLRMKLIGAAHTNPEAVGYCYGLREGIYTNPKIST